MRNPTPADDNLHPPESDDVFWTETAWFAFASPERKLTGCIYPMFRTNLKVCSAGVFVWDDSGEADHEILYSHNCPHLPLPEDLRAMRLPNGLSYDVVEPLREYVVRYSSDELKVELRYRGLIEPIMGAKGNHLDQPCHVTGHVALRGEEIAIDCFEMRDKSWEVRSDVNTTLAPELAIGSYCYGINSDSAFLCWTTGTSEDLTTAGVRGGWLLRDGTVSRLASGRRIAERMPGRPAHRMVIEATDQLGRSVTASGTTFNNYAMHANPSMLAWVSGIDWEVDGRPASGESQEWSAGSSRASRVLWLPDAEQVPTPAG
jgi:hypothetical protein